MIPIYRLPDGLYVNDTKTEADGYQEPDTEIWLEKVIFKPLKIWLWDDPLCGDIHPWKIEIDYLEEYRLLSDFGYESLDQVPQFLSSDYS